MNIELVIVRDPDGPVDVHVFIDGVEHAATEFTVDAGAGWTWDEWKDARDWTLATASSAARATLLGAYAHPPGGEHIDKPYEASWLDGLPCPDQSS
jgi:hypothetical protein